jgi:hypothetical protein
MGKVSGKINQRDRSIALGYLAGTLSLVNVLAQGAVRVFYWLRQGHKHIVETHSGERLT